MDRCMGSWVLAVGIVAGCGPSTSAGASYGSTQGNDAQDAPAGSTVTDSDGESGADADTGAIVGGPAVDCALLPGGGQTLAGGELSALGFPEYACNPRVSGEVGANGYRCCSVDPAAASGRLPGYAGNAGNPAALPTGVPYFSGSNNAVGAWGMCVRTGDIPAGSGLLEDPARDCPIPCNPRWDRAQTDVVCGAARQCCQTHPLQPQDCVLDPISGLWRPVTGADIPALSHWGPSEHATHQDPAGVACTQLAGGDPTSPVFVDCVRALSVADQRGVCLALVPGDVCPAASPATIDACEAMTR